MSIQIRTATEADFDRIWPIFSAVVKQGDTYAYPSDTSKLQAKKLWMELPRKTYLLEQKGQVLGTYYLKTNQSGPGEHVCNCGYMVSEQARGMGLATAMCEHSQREAIAMGYQAMQFNFVASTNEGAIKLWKKLGFKEVGCLPKAFKHPTLGLVDALVMYKWLQA